MTLPAFVQAAAICAALLSYVGWAHAAEFRDGMVAMDHDNPKKALAIWTALAEKGDAVSQQMMGQIYMAGILVKQDDKKAFSLLSRCEGKTPPCDLSLGELYADGRGVMKDAERAAGLYRKVIETKAHWPEGVNEARVKLGLLYYTKALGDGKRLEGKEWFRLAAEEGDAKGQMWLATVINARKGENNSPEELIQGYMWCTLASKDKDVTGILAKSLGDNFAKKMTLDEIEKAQRLARAWRPKTNQ